MPYRKQSDQQRYFKQWYAKNKNRLSTKRKTNRVENRDANLRYYRKYYQKHKEKIQLSNAKWRLRYPDKYAALKLRQRLSKYGLNLESYAELRRKQGGRCGICTKRMRIVYIDHDHATNKVRGLLCQPCNILLGLAKDSVDTLASAIVYLRRSRED